MLVIECPGENAINTELFMKSPRIKIIEAVNCIIFH
jgi:hypothetical protein